MGKCLVTKLNGAIEDTSMLRIGEMRVHFSKVDSPTKVTQQLVVVGTKEGVLEIIGNGHFTDETLTQNLGKTAKVKTWKESVYVSEEVREVAILDKYSIKLFLSSYPAQDASNKDFDLSSLKYSRNLTNLNFGGSSVYGDISNLKDCPLEYLYLMNTNIEGDISSLAKMNLANFQISNIKGNISALYNMSKLSGAIFDKCELQGDLALLPKNMSSFLVDMDKGSAFTWSNRPSDAKILSIGYMTNSPAPYLSNVDKMLQDQANCEAASTSRKTIAVTGTRTSASDAAVQTLQSKGYTVSITPA